LTAIHRPTSSGEPTGAVYGFARKLLSIIREYQPEYLAVAFDLGDTWRHAEFPEYKGTRERMPDEMQVQMGRIDQFLHAFNIPILTSPDNEADDVLGTLSRLAPQHLWWSKSKDISLWPRRGRRAL